MFKRTLAITRKEIIHIIRDPRSLTIMFAMPISGWVIRKMPTMANPEHIPAMPSVTIIRSGPA